jgi:hypothetical protein
MRESTWLSSGFPRGLVALTAILVLVGLLYTVAHREPAQVRGYAEFTMFRGACIVDPAQRRNVSACEALNPRLYRVRFTRSITGSTPLATRGTCCPGQIRASLQGDRAVLIAITKPPTAKQPVRANVLVP